MKKVVIINSTALRLKIVAEVFAKKYPEQEIDFIPLDVPYECSDILDRMECLAVMRDAVGMAKQEIPDAAYYVAMRGRFQETKEGLEESALVVVINEKGIESYSQAVSFQVPDALAEEVRKGVKFAKAVEKIYGLSGVRDGGGYCGFLTNGLVTKADQYFDPLVIALSSLDAKSREGEKN